MQIRRSHEEDCAGLARLQVDSYQSAYAGIFPPAYLEHFTYQEQEQDWLYLLTGEFDDVLLVADTGANQLAGYALVTPTSDEFPNYAGELVAIHVGHPFQRQGLGSSLMRAVCQELTLRDCNSLFLWILARNSARRFYERLGGRLIGEKGWVNNTYFGTDISEVAYGWPRIEGLLSLGKGCD